MGMSVRIRTTAAAVIGLLISTMLASVVFAAPAPPEPLTPDDALTMLGVSESEPLPEPELPQVPTGELVAPTEEAVQPLEPVEPSEAIDPVEVPDRAEYSKSKVLDRDETSTTYELENGERVTELSPSPVNVEVSPGGWVPSTPAVSSSADGGLAAPVHPLQPSFAAESGGDSTLTVERGGYVVSIALEGSKARSVEVGSTGLLWDVFGARYENVLPDADLTYKLDASAVKESLVLKEHPGESTPGRGELRLRG
ncbi:hypothetical protein [Aeromicrobium alkaliterrae]|uniref:AMIN domain-containing protein n=1 Tax=Aeromicrobium alkaliterrae TaxID=302168 RepID=A0ABN2KER4_9ACTN